MSEFIFVREDKAECAILLGSPLAVDFSSAELLAKKIREISGAEVEIEGIREMRSRKKVFIGTLSESPCLQKILEQAGVFMGLDHPEAQKFNFDKQEWYAGVRQALEASPSLFENRLEVLKRCLRGNGLYPEDLGEQGFIVYKLDDDTLVLCGGSPQGTFYAVQTIINHLYLKNGNLMVEDLHTEKFPILSRPAIPCRVVCTNVGGPDHVGRDQWVKEWQKGDEYDYKGFIDWLARFKITHLNLWLFELAFGIAYPSAKFPECVNKYHPNVKKEFMGDLIEYAHKKFMDVSIFIDFPDMFSGILCHHPELGAKRSSFTKFPSEEDWQAYQKTGENKGDHDFRHAFGTVCASKPEVMSFWEEYLKEVFNRYPSLDGIVGQFAEGVDGRLCACDNCRNNFLDLQWRYFRRMAEIARQDKPERKIYNCASTGAVEILRHRGEIKNFIQFDWGGEGVGQFLYNHTCLHGEWYLLHHMGQKWQESDWKCMSRVAASSHLQGLAKRGVSYFSTENDYFAFGEFAWNPELGMENYADRYIKFSLRKKDDETSALYAHWIKAQGYCSMLKQLRNWKANKIPFSAREIDAHYPRLLEEELAALSSLLERIKGKNRIVDDIEKVFRERRDEMMKSGVPT